VSSIYGILLPLQLFNYCLVRDASNTGDEMTDELMEQKDEPTDNDKDASYIEIKTTLKSNTYSKGYNHSLLDNGRNVV